MSETAAMIVRPIEATDHAEWRRLWDAYCAFYKVQLSEQVTARTWERLLDERHPMIGFVAATAEGRALSGICHCILHDNTWGTRPICYLEDLYVDAATRGRGVGRSLIQHVICEAKARGWARVYWVTEEDNYAARRLYDQFVKRDEFVRYAVRFE
jgi:GNAT superfamily N-acetyltransferase